MQMHFKASVPENLCYLPSFITKGIIYLSPVNSHVSSVPLYSLTSIALQILIFRKIVSTVRTEERICLIFFNIFSIWQIYWVDMSLLNF